MDTSKGRQTTAALAREVTGALRNIEEAEAGSTLAKVKRLGALVRTRWQRRMRKQNQQTKDRRQRADQRKDNPHAKRRCRTLNRYRAIARWQGKGTWGRGTLVAPMKARPVTEEAIRRNRGEAVDTL